MRDGFVSAPWYMPCWFIGQAGVLPRSLQDLAYVLSQCLQGLAQKRTSVALAMLPRAEMMARSIFNHIARSNSSTSDVNTEMH